MTLKQAIGVNSYGLDVKTGKELTPSEVYGRAIDLLGGLDEIAKFIPFPLEELQKAYETGDTHFNNIGRLSDWDNAAGFDPPDNSEVAPKSGLLTLFRQYGINEVSVSDGVCVLKEAAKQLVERSDRLRHTPLFEEWYIRECYVLWDVKEIHVRLNATEVQKAEIFRRASPSQVSEMQNATNGEVKAIWAHIYEDKSARLFLPCDVALTPNESASLVSTVETVLGKSVEEALLEAKERHTERFKEKNSQSRRTKPNEKDR